MFFDELIHEAHLLRTELEIALQNWSAPGGERRQPACALIAASKRQQQQSAWTQALLAAWMMPGAGRCYGTGRLDNSETLEP